MEGISMDSTPRSLEDEFFFRQDQQMMERKRALEQMKETKEALREASGIQDDSVLQKLVELNIRPETVASLAIVPLIEVAWANGEVGAKEKAVVLAAVGKFGWNKGSGDYVLMERWLEHKPDESLLNAWVHYTETLCARMNPDEVQKMKTEIMSHARSIAEAGGGVLGIGKVSDKEKTMLALIEKSFAKSCVIKSVIDKHGEVK
jgi:hypothetical protein